MAFLFGELVPLRVQVPLWGLSVRTIALLHVRLQSAHRSFLSSQTACPLLTRRAGSRLPQRLFRANATSFPIGSPLTRAKPTLPVPPKCKPLGQETVGFEIPDPPGEGLFPARAALKQIRNSRSSWSNCMRFFSGRRAVVRDTEPPSEVL